MTNSLVRAFLVGRVFAEAVSEQLEATITDALSELSKFDAEQRERLQQFAETVIERANRVEADLNDGNTGAIATPLSSEGTDLQSTIDELRAEIAHLRTELQHYRSQSR